MMADDTPASALGPLPQTAAAPGLQEPSTSSTNGSSNPSHMPPPPLPPVVIPQNNNPIPTAVTSPFSNSATGLMTPSSAGGSVRRAAPEPNKRALYVGGLDPKVGEDLLRQIFETAGHVVSVKIIPDKNVSRASCSFAHQPVSFLHVLHWRRQCFERTSTPVDKRACRRRQVQWLQPLVQPLLRPGRRLIFDEERRG